MGSPSTVPATVLTGWWYYSPTWQENTLRAEAEEALAANQLDRAAKALQQLVRLAPDRLDNQLIYAQVLRRLERRSLPMISPP